MSFSWLGSQLQLHFHFIWKLSNTDTVFCCWPLISSTAAMMPTLAMTPRLLLSISHLHGAANPTQMPILYMGVSAYYSPCPFCPVDAQPIYSCARMYSTPLWKILRFCFREKNTLFQVLFQNTMPISVFCKAIISSLNLLDHSLD